MTKPVAYMVRGNGPARFYPANMRRHAELVANARGATVVPLVPATTTDEGHEK